MKKNPVKVDFLSIARIFFSQSTFVAVGISLTTTFTALSFDRWVNPEASLVQADLVEIIQTEIEALAQTGAPQQSSELEAVRRSVELVVSNMAYQEGLIIIASQAIVAGGNKVPDVTERIQHRVKEAIKRGQ